MEYVRSLLALWVEAGDDGIGALQCCEKDRFCRCMMSDALGCLDHKWRDFLLEVDNDTRKRRRGLSIAEILHARERNPNLVTRAGAATHPQQVSEPSMFDFLNLLLADCRH